MDKQEYLLLIPAIVFGVAIVDLLKIFSHKKGYYELIGWGVYLLVAICWLWYETFDKLDTVIVAKAGYFMIIVQAILYYSAASILSPEEKDVDTKLYFMSIKKSFFLLLTLIALTLIFMQFVVYNDEHIVWIRFVAIALFLGCAFVENAWLRNGVLIFLGTIKIYLIMTL
jgi:hypothetical protein